MPCAGRIERPHQPPGVKVFPEFSKRPERAVIRHDRKAQMFKHNPPTIGFLQGSPDLAEKSLWPRHVIIEAIEREGLPDCIEQMHLLGYRNVLKTRANLGMALQT